MNLQGDDGLVGGLGFGVFRNVWEFGGLGLWALAGVGWSKAFTITKTVNTSLSPPL